MPAGKHGLRKTISPFGNPGRRKEWVKKEPKRKLQRERQELRLSTAYEVEEKEPELELRVQVLNINEGFNEELKEACLTLGEYMQYVDKIRLYAKEMSIDEAVDRAVDECIEQGILRDFLLQNKAGVKHMSIFEYNEEDVRQVLREEAHEEGYEEGYEKGKTDGEIAGMREGKIAGMREGKREGKIEALLYLLEEKGTIPEEMAQRLKAETDEVTLRKWLKLAGSTASVKEFQARL